MNGKSVKKEHPLDVTSAIIEYEQGDLSQERTLELFQHLVDTGLAWQLQGHYGRTAANLLAQGLIKPTTETARRVSRRSGL